MLDVASLSVSFGEPPARIVDGVSFSLRPGRTLGVVGESGSGKSMTALALMGLLPPGARATGRVMLEGADLLALDEARRRDLRGRRMAMIFQEPATALNPVMPVGRQVAEMLEVHEGQGTASARRAAVALLKRVGIADAEARAGAYPHQISGGMRQRVIIAMALACRPALLIADEPTTALDVCVQAQILDLLLELQEQDGTAILFISHNLGVVAEVADEVMVMYAGRAVESGPAESVLTAPAHPYTAGLIASLPDLTRRQAVLPVIGGFVPDLRRRPSGCAFHPRCGLAGAECRDAPPALHAVAGTEEAAHRAACLRA